jgi:DNA gyrase subunit A
MPSFHRQTLESYWQLTLKAAKATRPSNKETIEIKKKMKRPDLSGLSSDITNYIDELEKELELLRNSANKREHRVRSQEIDEIQDSVLPELSEPPEPPSTISLITFTASGIAKRTPRHLYALQRRGGMGIFDLDTSENDPPKIITIADQNQNLLLITNFGRGFRLPVQLVPETPIRARGATIVTKFNLSEDEQVAVVLPEQAQGYLALLSQSGMVRVLRHHVFGDHMKPGTALYDFRAFGFLAGAAWTPGDGDLFVATQQGRAIRFAEKLISPQGTQAIRLAEQDKAVSIAAVYDDSGVFMLSADGRGTIRLMEGFAPNKAPGAGGKIALTTDKLVCALGVENTDQLFIISSLSKIIRFRVDDIPPKDGIVQGVVCISLRGDEPVTAINNPTH